MKRLFKDFKLKMILIFLIIKYRERRRLCG